MFTGFWKLVLTVGLVSIGALVFAIFTHNQQTAKIELDQAKLNLEKTGFDSQFDESWSKGMAEMAESKKEKKYWQNKAEADQKKYAQKKKEALKNVAKAQLKHDIVEGKVVQFSNDMENSIKKIPDISEKEFEEALKKMEANK